MSDYYCVIHPAVAQSLREMAAREQWAYTYRAWRCAGKPAMSCRAMLEKYKVPNFMAGIGKIEGVRYIEGGLQ